MPLHRVIHPTHSSFFFLHALITIIFSPFSFLQSMAIMKTILVLSLLLTVGMGMGMDMDMDMDMDTTSLARPRQLNATATFSSSPAPIQLLHKNTSTLALSYALLSATNGAAEFGLLLYTYNGRPACSAAVVNATSYIMWMRPCPPLAYANCTLTFTATGDLILATDTVTRWSSHTYSKGVSGIRVSNKGELQILNKNNQSVWDSADSDPTASSCLAQFEPTLPHNPPLAAACAPSSSSSKPEDNSSPSSNFSLDFNLVVMMMGVVLFLHCLL